MGLEIDFEVVSLLEKISRQLDDIISRLPTPPSSDLSGKHLDNFYDQSAYKKSVVGTTEVDENFKYSFSPRISDRTND